MGLFVFGIVLLLYILCGFIADKKKISLAVGGFPWAYGAANEDLRLGVQIGRSAAVQKSNAQKMLGWHPLSGTPIIFSAMAELNNGDTEQAEISAKEGLRRDGRTELGYLVLIQSQIMTKNYADFLRSSAVLYRLNPDSATQVVAMVDMLAKHGEARQQVLHVAKESPAWRAMFVGGLLKQKNRKSLDTAKRILSEPVMVDEVSRRLQLGLVSTVLSNRDYSEAFDLWQNFYANLLTKEDRLIRNSNFAIRKLAGPYSWKYYSGPLATVEPSAGGGVDIYFSTNQEVRLLSQQLMLRPSRYKITIDGIETNRNTDQALVLKIKCAGGNASIIDAPISNIGKGSKQAEFEFDVPKIKTCRGQTVFITGQSKRGATSVEAHISSARIEAMGAQ